MFAFMSLRCQRAANFLNLYFYHVVSSYFYCVNCIVTVIITLITAENVCSWTVHMQKSCCHRFHVCLLV